LSRYHTRHALARARGALSRTKRTTALLAGLAATGATAAALALPASTASATTWHAIYLSSNVGLALAAPNNVTSGSQAKLKTCKQNVPGFCTSDGNAKLTEQFRKIPNSTDTVVLNQNGLCLTNRSVGGPAVFEACGNAGVGYASQHWASTLTPGGANSTIQNMKTGGFLAPAGGVGMKDDPVITSTGQWRWGESN
jgi:predicted lipoprotein with Yx(FWY)xxD motif